MSRRSRAASLAFGVAFVLVLPAAQAHPARAATKPDPAEGAARWSDAFADEADTVVFLAPASLVRAPFSMSGGDTVWRAPDSERLAWVATSPDRRHLAWLSRSSDRSATTLWLWDAEGVRRRAGYAPLAPTDYGVPRFASGQPSLDDADATGGRFVASGAMTRTNSANALTWDWAGTGVWLGYRDGIALAPVDTTTVRVVSPALALGLRRLDPAPMLYAEVIRLGQGRDAAVIEESRDYARSGTGRPSGIQDPNASKAGGNRVEAQPGAYVMYPGLHELRAFRVPGFDPSDPWTASATTVWWIDGARSVSAVRADDSRGTFEFEDPEPIVWFEYIDTRHALFRALGSALIEREETGNRDRKVFATGSPIRAVFAAGGDPARYVMTRDSLLVWDPGSGAVRGVALDGAVPVRVLAAAGGVRVLVSGEAGHDVLRLDRLDPDATKLVSLGAPALKKAAVTLTPSGRRLLLYPAGERPPRVVEMCDIAKAGWTEVALPEVLGWERVER